MLTRRTPLRKKRPTPRRTAARCAYVAPSAKSGRCKRSPYRKGVSYCGTHLVALIDAEARRRVFERDSDTCQRCGAPGTDWSHFPSRSYRGSRWLLDGAVVHCRPCHYWLTMRPLEHRAWTVAHFGAERVAEVEALALEVALGRAKPDLIQTATNFGLLAVLAQAREERAK